MKSLDLIPAKVISRRYGKKVEAETEGMETIQFGFEEVDVWPKFCVRDGHCFQCHIEGKILCSPRFRL